jgi:hypothetical protein
MIESQSAKLRRLSGEMASTLSKKYIQAMADGDEGYARTLAGLIQQNLSFSESQNEKELRQAMQDVGDELGIDIEFNVT